MQPLSKEEKAAIREAHPEAAPGEIESEIAEYEQLLADRFADDPDNPDQPVPAPAALEVAEAGPEGRLRELHARLFGPGE